MKDVRHVWNEITLESAEFVLNQAEKRLQATIDSARGLNDRAVNVMQFSIPLSVALIGLIVSEPGKHFLWSYLLMLFLSILISYMSVHLYNLYKVQLIGYKPSELLDENNAMLDEDEHLLILAFSVICEIEKAIELNETNNRRRERWFHLTMVLVKLQILLASVLFAGGSVIHALQWR